MTSPSSLTLIALPPVIQPGLDVKDDKLWHVSWFEDLLATCGTDRTTRIYSRSSASDAFQEQCALDDVHSRTTRSCEFNPQGDLLATASFDGTTVVWEKGWKPCATLEGHENEVKSVAWNCAGTLLATCGRDKTVWVWEAPPDKTGRPVMDEDENIAPEEMEWSCMSVLSGHEGDVKFVKFHPTEDLLVSCSYDDTVRIWAYNDDEHDFEAVVTLRGHENTVWGCAFIDNDTFVTCSQDMTCKTWTRRVAADEGMEDVDGEGDEAPQIGEWHLQFSFDSKHARTVFSIDVMYGKFIITAGGDNAICVHRLNNNGVAEFVCKVEDAHDQDINCVRWNRNVEKPLLATCGDDGRVRVWQVLTN